MGDSILDYLDNSWGQILGINTANAAPAAAPSPPPASTMATAGPFSPSGAADVNAVTGNPVSGNTPLWDPGSGIPTMPGPQPSAPAGAPAAAPGGAPMPQPGFGGGNTVTTQPPAPNVVPLGPPPPPSGGGGGPMGGAPQIPTSTGPVMPGPPSTGAPPPPPPGLFNQAPPTGSTGGLAGAMGLGPQNPNAGVSPLTMFTSGLGRGLENVGRARPGTSASQLFAAGAGGGLVGGEASQERQQAQYRQAQNDLFNKSSQAFKDMLAAQGADDNSALRRAHSNYFTARARQMMIGGGSGSGAWQNTPYGKTIQIENEAQKYEKGQQIILAKRWQLNQTSPEDQQHDLEELNKRTEDYRNRLYKQAGINPQDADKLKNMGTAQDNPFDTKGMTLDQFNSQVPMGAWFKDQNGVVRQRTVPPPGDASGRQSANDQQNNYDDQTALNAA